MTYQFQTVLLYISKTVDHIIEILIMIPPGFFFFFKKNPTLKLNIKIILFFISPLQQFFLYIFVFQVHQ